MHLGELIARFQAALESQDESIIETERASLLGFVAGW
jgi:hypothetical protein